MTIEVSTESTLPDGKVRRRYEVSATDLQGNTHVEVLGMFVHDSSDDGSGVELQYLEAKRVQEIEQYKAYIESGINPFATLELLWNSRAGILKAVLDDALSLPATEAMVHNGLPYLAAVSDGELMTLYGKDQAWVNSVRQKASELLAAKAILDSYQAVL